VTSRSRIAALPCELRVSRWLPEIDAYHRADIAAGHQLGLFHRALDRMHGRFDVDHRAALHAARHMGADADHGDRLARLVLTDNRHHFRGADIEADDQLFVVARLS
jgi:hypothetical protein